MSEHISATRIGAAGLLTLDRPRALNALSLPMVRELTRVLLQWRTDPEVGFVALRGMGRDGPFGAFCAGGDIRFFHQAALAGDPALEDFFTEEYRLDHLVHVYGKPVLVFMDGIVMGGGMGLAQGARWRIATERTKMAMPETQIGLFPDVGGGWFLARCPGHLGEYLALTGRPLDGAQARAAGLADGVLDSARIGAAWDALAALPSAAPDSLAAWAAHWLDLGPGRLGLEQARVDRHFGLPGVPAIVASLEAAAAADPWAAETAAALRQRSPLMLHVALEQIRRARSLDIAGALRLERDLMRHTFFPAHLGRSGAATDSAEGIRALALDKDHAPRWNPARIEEVRPEMVAPFFDSPWPAQAHPLRDLG